MPALAGAAVKGGYLADGEESWLVMLTDPRVPGCGERARGADRDATGDGASHEDAGERRLREARCAGGAQTATG